MICENCKKYQNERNTIEEINEEASECKSFVTWFMLLGLVFGFASLLELRLIGLSIIFFAIGLDSSIDFRYWNLKKHLTLYTRKQKRKPKKK